MEGQKILTHISPDLISCDSHLKCFEYTLLLLKTFISPKVVALAMQTVLFAVAPRPVQVLLLRALFIKFNKKNAKLLSHHLGSFFNA